VSVDVTDRKRELVELRNFTEVLEAAVNVLQGDVFDRETIGDGHRAGSGAHRRNLLKAKWCGNAHTGVNGGQSTPKCESAAFTI
jgi:hypothetical protein